jgi:transketolase
MVRTAIEVAKSDFTEASVWSVSVLKPVAAERIEAICRESELLVTLEEHSVYGGLGSAVAEISASVRPRPILQIGVADRFSERCGSYEYLLTEHGLDLPTVRKRIGEFIAAF